MKSTQPVKPNKHAAFIERYRSELTGRLAEAAKKVKLLWYCRTDNGWRYLADNPATRTQYPQGRLMLRERVNGQRIYTPVQDAANPTKEVQAAKARAMRPKASQTAGDNPDSLSAAIVAYIANRKAHNRLEAAENARVVLNEFRQLLPTVKTVRGISTEHLTQFCAALREKGLSDHTVSNKYNRLRSFLKFAGHDVKLSKDDRPKYETTVPTIYTEAEEDALLKHSDEYMRVAITMGTQLGLREQELMHAEWSDIKREGKGTIFLVQSKPAYGFNVKDKEQREVTIPSELLTMLDKWQRKRKQKVGLILGIGAGHARPNGHLLRWLQRVAKRANVTDATLHKMRRTYVTTLLRDGYDLATVQAFAGHSNLASTMRYLKPAGASEMQTRINSTFSKKKKEKPTIKKTVGRMTR